MAELNAACSCGRFLVFAYKTTIFGITIRHTVMCANCGRKGKGRTLEKAIEAWNRSVNDG